MTRVMHIGWAALAALLALAAVPALAQDSDPPQQEFEGLVEIAYRGVNQSGSVGKYNEDFDGLDSGLRLSNLQASWWKLDSGIADYVRLDAGGLGGDPYEHANLAMGRRDVYELKVNHRRQVYLYDLFGLAGDQDGSTWNAIRTTTDMRLTVHATPNIDLFVEYQEQRRDGTSLFMKTVETDLFRLETPLDQSVQRYTIGGRFALGPADLVIRQSMRRYDYRFNNTTRGDAGLNTGDAVTLDDYAWRQRDDGDADLTTLSFATPLGSRCRFNVTASGTLLGRESLESDVVLDASGTSANGSAYTVAGGTSRADLDVEHLVIDADLSFRLTDELDLILQWTSFNRDVDGTQLRDLDANGVIDDTEGIVLDTTPGSTVREDYTSRSITALVDYAPLRSLRLRAGYRTLDRELVRDGFEYGTNDNRNDRFESDDDTTLVLGAVVKPVPWFEFRGDYEKGDITQAFTAVSPMERDRLRLRARFKPSDKLKIDIAQTDFENTNRGLDFRRTASCTTPGGNIEDGCWNSAVEGRSSSIALWHQPHADFDYQLRWAQQDTDSLIRVRFDTELFFNSADNGDSIYDNVSTQLSARANVRWNGHWSAFVRGQRNDADGDNALIGTSYRNVILIEQDFLDLEFGLTRTLSSGVYVGGRVRHFEYGDANTSFDYDGDILTLLAGLRF